MRTHTREIGGVNKANTPLLPSWTAGSDTLVQRSRERDNSGARIECQCQAGMLQRPLQILIYDVQKAVCFVPKDYTALENMGRDVAHVASQEQEFGGDKVVQL
jgi:hypothetical protein